MLKNLLLPVFILFASANCMAQKKQQWKLIWADEFNYTGLPDSAKWNYDIGGHGWGNNEAQYYTRKELNNARVENGYLIITAIKEKIDSNSYSSARLVTKGKADWLYGKIEVKAKLPKGRGTWPAIWMLASTNPLKWPDDGEIDIMEHVGFDPGKIHFSAHTKKYHHSIGTQKTGSTVVVNAQDKFHIYSIVWNSEKIEWFVDGKKVFAFANEHTGSEAWPFSKPFHLLLNVAVGGFWGGQKGIDETVFPQQMLVDYVRVYQ
jgi:beta-glucanase (GH16 family)